jgi:hypothetical protein
VTHVVVAGTSRALSPGAGGRAARVLSPSRAREQELKVRESERKLWGMFAQTPETDAAKYSLRPKTLLDRQVPGMVSTAA